MNRIVIDTDRDMGVVNRHVYGHFAEHLGRCIYGGIWVGEDSDIPNIRGIRTDVVEALKALRIPNLRWPGGCFADTYHWKDGIGPRKERPSIVNIHWGGVTEDNSFGTHEFLDLCGQLGCEPYICGNVGSGTVQEMAEWVEYVNSDAASPMTELRKRNGREEPWSVKFWGVGNESWGCGGNMLPEYYADVYRRYATFCGNHGGSKLYRIACGPNDYNYRWTEVLMENFSISGTGGRRSPSDFASALALHYYTVDWKNMAKATGFGEQEWFTILETAVKMDEIITRHSAIMDRTDPDGRVALVVDEWGTWYDVEPGTNPRFLYQQNSLRDALAASLTFDIFHRHNRRVTMANIAQTVNVLQAMILTDGEAMVLTPTYHVFEMNSVHHDAALLDAKVSCTEYRFGDRALPGLGASATRDSSGKIHVTVTNLDPTEDVKLSLSLEGRRAVTVGGRVLTAGTVDAHNTFDAPDAVRPRALTSLSVRGGVIEGSLPARSVSVIEIT